MIMMIDMIDNLIYQYSLSYIRNDVTQSQKLSKVGITKHTKELRRTRSFPNSWQINHNYWHDQRDPH